MISDTVAFKMPHQVVDTVVAIVNHPHHSYTWMMVVMVVVLLLLYHALRKMDE